MADRLSLDRIEAHRSWDRRLSLKYPYNVIRYGIMNPPITPGEILLEEYLQPMGISQNAMARAIGVAPRAINEIVLGKRSITPAMSIRFGAFFAQSPEFWHGIQVECDFRVLAKEVSALTSQIRPAAELISS
jgi:addiction module HigA family antidote